MDLSDMTLELKMKSNPKYTDETFYSAVKGDKKSLDLTIKQFTPLVHKFVLKYQFMTQSHMYEDLVQEGILGIWKAVQTFDLSRMHEGKKIKPMTWIFLKVRAAVQGAARKDKNNPQYPLSLEQSDWGMNLVDPASEDVSYDLPDLNIEDILKKGCKGDPKGKKAQIIIDRFGLDGKEPMRQMEVAEKYGMSKQSLNGYLTRFYNNVQKKCPELKTLVH